MAGRISATQLLLNSKYSGLSDIGILFEQSINEPLRIAKKKRQLLNQLLPNQSKKFTRWSRPDSNARFSFSFRGVESRVLVSTVFMEIQARTLYADVRHTMLKDANDLKHMDDVRVIFYELDNRVRVIICSKEVTVIERVKELIGKSNVSTDEESKYNSDFFAWLFWVYMKQDRNLQDLGKIQTITGFRGNVIDSQSDSITGLSASVSDLNVTKTHLSLGEPLESISIALQVDESTITFAVSSHGTLSFSRNKFSFNEDYIDIHKSSELEDFQIAVLLYAFILPILRIEYLHSGGDYRATKNTFKKALGIEVIEQIMRANHIETWSIANND